MAPWVILLLSLHDLGKFADGFRSRSDWVQKLQGRTVNVPDDGEPYWFSRITPRPDLGYRQIVALGDLDPYGPHQALWKLFDAAPEERTNRTEFLFRAEQQKGLPAYFVLLSRQRETQKPHASQAACRREHSGAGDRRSAGRRVGPQGQEGHGVRLGILHQ